MFEASDDTLAQSPRRRARVLALKSLFEADLVGHDPIEVVGRLVDEAAAERNVANYARRLVEGVVQDRQTIDGEIARAAPAWPIEQMPAIDKNLLRLAIYELIHDNSQVPAKVAWPSTKPSRLRKVSAARVQAASSTAFWERSWLVRRVERRAIVAAIRRGPSHRCPRPAMSEGRDHLSASPSYFIQG
jgi:N utilization substance protein B